MDRQFFKEYYFLERSHWWFLGRLMILERMIKKHDVKEMTCNLKILNIGAATGATSLL